MWRQPDEEYKDKCVLPTVKHGGGSFMDWGCMSGAGTGELQFIEGTMNAKMNCDILKQSMIPSLGRLDRRAVFQHVNDPKHTSKTTPALLKKLRVKVICGESSNGRRSYLSMCIIYSCPWTRIDTHTHTCVCCIHELLILPFIYIWKRV